MPDNTTVLPNKGTPQGGIISPLLANIVLNELDWWIASQWEKNPIAISRGRERIIGKTKVFDKSHGYRIMKNTEMKEMHIIRYADDFRIFCRTKEDAVRTKEAVAAWIEERLKLEVSPEKTRIVNTRKRWSEFLGFKIRVRLKHHKYVVQSAICDKKVEIERAKLVEQAKNIAKPREKKSCLSEIQLYNSMVLGIQNYYQLATCISIDCREFHRRVMTVLTNRLNTETGSMLKREGGTITQAEKERFGQSKMIRYVSGIDQMIYPIAFIKNKIPMAKGKGSEEFQKYMEDLTDMQNHVLPYLQSFCNLEEKGVKERREQQIAERYEGRADERVTSTEANEVVKDVGKTDRKPAQQKQAVDGKDKKLSIHERLEINKRIIQEKQGKDKTERGVDLGVRTV